MSEEVLIEVIGTSSCQMCRATHEVARRAIEKLGLKNAKVEEVPVVSHGTINKYRVLLFPSLAINGKLKIVGRVPSVDEVVNIIKSELGV